MSVAWRLHLEYDVSAASKSKRIGGSINHTKGLSILVRVLFLLIIIIRRSWRAAFGHRQLRATLLQLLSPVLATLLPGTET